ncbi:RHS repeat domain-containing protein [Olivibacter sp. CPCC 100613]|uniref:RHS repeat domain-containing protein n=1 Tax=Olivibacter sp. CPCC 100613 TaxID=3079931 RepID=UPI002FF45C28
MKHLRFLGLIIIASQSLTAVAQTGTNPSVSNPLMPSLDNVSPPSPNVSALNKFGDIPVGPSTGIPQVTVPIYTWSNKNFGKDINISLDYHAGGIKVDETASDVGLGWALNAGGVVSRTVRGIYDEYPIDGFLYKAMPVDIIQGNAGGMVNDRIFNKINAGLMDSQNDLFNYNFNGRNGRFLLGKNNDVLLIEQAKLKISYTISNDIYGKPLITKITILDEEGYTFVFNDCETIENNLLLPTKKQYTSSWYLSEIVHPAGKDKITFQYEAYNFDDKQPGSATHAISLTHEGKSVTYGVGEDRRVVGKRIKLITFPDGNQVDFTYKTASRLDLISSPTAKLLDKITIRKGIVIKGYKLHQDYSLSGRATLLSVTEFGGPNETALKPYSFSYFQREVLPARFSGAQDHWGYANYNNNGERIPREFFRAPGGQYPPYRELLGGNRDTDQNRVKAGSLEKIAYPTGGHTIFEMEANKAKDNWLEQNLPVTVQLPPYTDRSINESLNSDQSPSQFPFAFKGENNTTTQFKLTVYPDGSGSSSAIKYELYNNSNQLLNTQQVNFSASNVNPIERSFSVNNLIKNANYYFKVYTINLSQYYNYTEIGWREINPGGSYDTVLRHVQPFVGGIRVKRISDYSENSGSPVKVREYEYTMEDGVTSSGALGIRPVYSYLASYDFEESPSTPGEPVYRGNPTNPNYIVRTSGGVNPAIFVNGSPVTYKRVVEKIGQGGNYLGKTVRYFTNFNESPPYISEDFPFVPPQYASWYYGKLKREEIYNSSNQIIRTIENTYGSITDSYAANPTRVENFRSVIISPVQFAKESAFWINPLAYPHYFLMATVNPMEGRTELRQTKVTESEPGQTPVITTTNYTYDAANYYLKQTSLIDSRNREVKTVLNYPRDMVTANIDASIYQGMIDKNIISPVIEEKVSVGGIQQTARTTKYAKWNNNFYAPERVKTKKMALAEEDRIIYLQYDSHAAPLSVQQATGPKVSYIWGYGGMHLLAQIANMEYSQIQTLLGGATAIETFRNKTAPTDAEIDAFLAPLVNGLPAEASIVRFKHDTLRGLTGQLDEAGRKTSYEYDEFNRLKAVRDQQGNLLEEYKYNYRNQ